MIWWLNIQPNTNLWKIHELQMKKNETRLTTIGKAFHCLMEFSGDFTNLSHIKAKNLTSEFPLSSSDQNMVLQSIKKITNSVECMKLLDSNPTYILIESEWISEFGEILRPDRVDFNLCEKTINIIDFKWRISEKQKNSYVLQMLKYQKLIESNYPDMVVKSFLVSSAGQISYIQGHQLLHLY